MSTAVASWALPDARRVRVRPVRAQPTGAGMCVRKNHLRLVQAFEQPAAGRRIGNDVVPAITGGRGWGYAPVLEAIVRGAAVLVRRGPEGSSE